MKVILELTSKNESLGISFPNKLVQVQEDITQAITASGLDLSALLNKLKDEGEKTAKVQKLLKSLMYSSIKFRERAIETAHDTTLEWMFDTPDTKFTEWLEEGDGVYWINGLVSNTIYNFLNQTTNGSIARQWKVNDDEVYLQQRENHGAPRDLGRIRRTDNG